MKSTALLFDFAGTFTDKDLEKKATAQCCQKYRLSPEQIREAVSGRKITAGIGPSVIKNCFKIFQQAVENSPILPGASEAIAYAVQKIGCGNLYVSTNADSDWVVTALQRSRMNYFRSVLGRNDGTKEEHFRKILGMGCRAYGAVIIFGDNPHDFPRNVGNGIRVIKVAVNVSPEEKSRFDGIGVNMLVEGPLTAEVVEKALMEAE
ncbi:MAG: hypothetical protein PHH21_02860 [Candidatus Pacebacteria bacterium]|nr:hypothetical protein [Candidatus Paceibacterota bacterium]